MIEVKWNKINLRAKDKNLPKVGEKYLFYLPDRKSYYIGVFKSRLEKERKYIIEYEWFDFPVKSGILWMELPSVAEEI